MKTLLGLTVLAAAASIALAAAAQAPAAAPAPPPYGAPITTEQAKIVLAAAEAEARKAGVNVSFAVVEPSGTLVLFQRMTDATYSSGENAQNKARSAAQWKRPTSSWIETVKASPAALTLANVVVSNGGEPIVVGGRIIGAVGVGGNGQFEGAIGKAAAAAIK